MALLNFMQIQILHKKLKALQKSNIYYLILFSFSEYFNVFSKPRMAKITKSLVDFIAKVPNSERLQIQMSQYLVEWCIKEKRNYLKHRI